LHTRFSQNLSGIFRKIPKKQGKRKMLSHLQKKGLRLKSLCRGYEKVPIELHIGDVSTDERVLGEESLLLKDEGLRVLAEELKYEETIYWI